VAKSFTIDAAVQRFLDHLLVERGLSTRWPRTERTSRDSPASSSAGRCKRLKLQDVGEPDVRAYLEHLVAGGMTIASQARHLTAVRCLFLPHHFSHHPRVTGWTSRLRLGS